MPRYKWNAEKNALLARERGVTFEDVVHKIEGGALVIEAEHPNPIKYPNQRILIVDIDGYAFLVPFARDGEDFFLKTIIPSRKATKKYLGG
ncbi:MAG: BrnT family toxin [Desulfovibrionales bacterium]|nr:MAG: BrnT family toxin [Desulfovibrionales bacterium]